MKVEFGLSFNKKKIKMQTKYQKIWNSQGKPFKILMVAQENKSLDPYLKWFKHRSLEEKKPGFFEGHVEIRPNVSRRYVMEIRTMNEEEFKKTSLIERSYDGIMFHLPGANLCRPSVAEPFEDWQQWGDEERKVKKLLFLEGGQCPADKYCIMTYKTGDWGIIPIMEYFLEDLASDEVVKIDPIFVKNDEYYYI
jgi:hypothetical protein